TSCARSIAPRPRTATLAGPSSAGSRRHASNSCRTPYANSAPAGEPTAVARPRLVSTNERRRHSVIRKPPSSYLNHRQNIGATLASDGFLTLLTGTNTHGLFDVGDEDLAIANATRLGGFLDRIEH